MEAEDIIKSVQSGKIAPIYFLHGEEPYYIDLISNFMHDHLLDASAQVFNQRVFYGKDTDYKMLVDEASQYPMMADRRLIILREAQDMKSFPQLESYFENPVTSTTIVVCHKYKKLDQRLKIAKLLNKNGVVFESKKLYDNAIPGWIQKEAVKKGIKLKPELCQLMADFVGADLGLISNNLDKLKIAVTDGEVITAEDMESVVGINKDFNVFELQKALGTRDKPKVYQIVNYFGSNPKANPYVVVIGTLYSYFSKLYVAKAGDYKSDEEIMKAIQVQYQNIFRDYKEALRYYSLPQIEKCLLLLREYDLKSKGVGSKNAEEGDLLREMVSKMMM